MSLAPLLIHLFGPPDFRVNGEPLPRLKTRKGLYLLALLALRQGKEVERSWLAGTLWPENDDATAFTYLRQALTDLRRALGDAAGLLQSTSPRTLRLDRNGADVDFIAFEQCLKRGDIPSLEQAVNLYQGSLMEGWAEEWLLAEREACQQSYLGVLETLAQQAMEARDITAAVPYLRRIVTVEPLRESAHRALMQALAATRDFAAVTQVYRDLRTTLRRDVNAEPDAETQALFTHLRTDARRQAADVTSVTRISVPTRTERSPITERTASRAVILPRPLSEFIGRTREMEAIKRALKASRLVTLMGIGGVGKTRLAIRVAEEVAEDFPDGVRFVDLSPLSDPMLVAKTVAAALGVPEQAGRSLTDSLCEYLGEQHFLLILDNCEHLPEECARLITALLQECPNIRILATSRQRLRVTGETMRRVPPLDLPDRRQLRDEDKNATAALMEYEAVRLFIDRAQRIQPNLYLNQQTLRAVAAICLRLDGVPLALELAAARMSALGAEQIAERLAEHFRLLSRSGSGDRSAPARQQTLRAALDWSHALLSAEERILLRRLSVFVEGWTLEAAEAVCAGNGLEEWEILDCLTGLADHSLVVFDSEGAQARYRLLEVVREYGREHLREHDNESAWLRVKHREYFQHLVHDALPYLGGKEQVEWLDRLERDHGNFRAALDGCLEEGTTEALHSGVRLAADLQRFWGQRGHAGEGRQRMTILLAREEVAQEASPERARALMGLGILAYRQGDFTAAREALDASIALHRQRGDRGSEAMPLSLLGNIARVQGDYRTASTLFDQALTRFRESGNRAGEGFTLGGIAQTALEQGAFTEARSLFDQALAISREVGDLAMEASLLNGLGCLADFQDDPEGARPWYELSLALHRELGDEAQMVIIMHNLGNAARALGDVSSAQKHFREALVLSRDLGASSSRRLLAYLLKGMAFTMKMRPLQERAAQLLGASEALREAIGVPLHPDDLPEYDRVVAELCAALGEETFALRRDEGRTMPIEQAISVALEQ
jgi:predicted ATPase/DNA-binding SARP family transcriptional activator/Flp pilus assembly protein TadD